MRRKPFYRFFTLFLSALGLSPFSLRADEPPPPHPDVMALIEKGEQAYQANQFEECLQLFNEALKKARTLADKEGEATTLNNLGRVYLALGQPQRALEFLQQALPLSREVGDKEGEATILSNLGQVYDYLGQPQQALEFYSKPCRYSERWGTKRERRGR